MQYRAARCTGSTAPGTKLPKREDPWYKDIQRDDIQYKIIPRKNTWHRNIHNSAQKHPNNAIHKHPQNAVQTYHAVQKHPQCAVQKNLAQTWVQAVELQAQEAQATPPQLPHPLGQRLLIKPFSRSFSQIRGR
eukprot:195821-Rhodomonas_salina.1